MPGKRVIFVAALLPIIAALAVTAYSADTQESGVLTLLVENHRGPVQGFVEILRYSEKSGEFAAVTKKPLLLGKVGISLPPGNYKARITSSQEIIPQVITKDITIVAGGEFEHKIHFWQATIKVDAQDGDGNPLEGSVILRRCDPDSETYIALPRKVRAVSGKATIYVGLGKYEVVFFPNGIIGCPGVSERRELKDSEEFHFKPSVSHGSLALASRNHLGPMPSRFTVYALGKTVRKPRPLYTRSFDGEPLKLRMLPGRYSIDISASSRSIRPPSARTIEPIEIKSGSEQNVQAYFECGRFRLDCDAFGEIEANLELQKWNEETRSYAAFDSIALKDKSTEITLAQGKYRVVVVDNAVALRQRYVLKEFDMADRGNVSRKVELRRGSICVLAPLVRDDPNATVSLIRRQGRVERSVLTYPLKKGRRVLRVPAGEYRIVASVTKGGKLKDYEGRWMKVTERSLLMEVLDLGPEYTPRLPPRINMWGPFEWGDGDGALEVGEMVKFTAEVNEGRAVSVKIFVLVPDGDGPRQEMIARSSVKDREIRLGKTGLYRIRVVAQRDGGAETVAELEFKVAAKK